MKTPARSVLITGGTGFVGKALVRELLARFDHRVVLASRQLVAQVPKGGEQFLFAQLDAQTDWRVGLAGVDTVIHMAARVHVMNDTEKDPLAAFRKTNVDATVNLAKQAAEAGVRRFIFVSSVKVLGEETLLGRPYTAASTCLPMDPYGLSKLEAEQQLMEIARQTDMAVVIIRPPLVYGPDVKGNMKSMLAWLRRSIPLPFGAIYNKRSLVALDNLVDLIITCIDHPAAANEIFMVSDGEDLSTTDLLRRTARVMGKRVILLPIPAPWLRYGAGMLGKKDIAQRLCGSLQVDIVKTTELLNWKPPITVDEGLRRMAQN